MPRRLLQLDVLLLGLNSAVAENGAREDSGLLPADWACPSLKRLKLDLHIDAADEPRYVFDETTRAAAFEIFAKLPLWFPNVKKLTLDATRPHIDFAVLDQLAELRSLKMRMMFDGDIKHLCADSNLQPLPRVSCFAWECGAAFPEGIDNNFPSLTKLKLTHAYPPALADLRKEVMSNGNSFQCLRKLVIDRPFFREPSPLALQELLLLLRSLTHLRKLISLKIVFSLYSDQWAADGDFSLVQSLPPNMRKVRFIDSLRPSAVAYNQELKEWYLSCMKELPRAEESVYKNWLRLLLCHINQHAALERVHCSCVAPSFAAIFALAEKWTKSSADAIADLGLICLTHVQCTPAYSSMCETRIPERGDRFTFRFTLAPPLLKTGGAERIFRPATKIVTVDFCNPY